MSSNKYRQSSPQRTRRTPPQIWRQSNQQQKHRQIQSLSHQNNSTELQQIMQLAKTFDMKIRSPIQLNEQLMGRKIPQRCTHHNNILSLYCEKDRKALCVSCVYHNDTHRGHHVIPICEAAGQMHNDINSTRQQIKGVIEDLDKAMRGRQENIQRMEMEYPHIISKLQRHYTNLHQILVRKEKEQVSQAQYLKEKIKYQNAAFITELNRIVHYIAEKADCSVKSMHAEEKGDLLTAHRILSTLEGVGTMIYSRAQNILLGQTLDTNAVSSAVFTGAGDYLIKTLQLSYPKQEKQQHENIRKLQQKNRTLSKSPPGHSKERKPSDSGQKSMQKSTKRLSSRNLNSSDKKLRTKVAQQQPLPTKSGKRISPTVRSPSPPKDQIGMSQRKIVTRFSNGYTPKTERDNKVNRKADISPVRSQKYSKTPTKTRQKSRSPQLVQKNRGLSGKSSTSYLRGNPKQTERKRKADKTKPS